MPCGLVNLGAGASCFLNSLLQCLFSCPLPLPERTDEDSFMREFCTLASELRVQPGPLDVVAPRACRHDLRVDLTHRTFCKDVNDVNLLDDTCLQQCHM